ncbi:MAG TPA: hypothetical protein VMY98_02415 [Anaerolineae bacterium]|nr:hypothetical protein [Anaerolineae bacterium]
MEVERCLRQSGNGGTASANLAVKALRRNGFEALFLEDGANVLSHVLTIVAAGALDLTGAPYLEYNRRSV